MAWCREQNLVNKIYKRMLCIWILRENGFTLAQTLWYRLFAGWPTAIKPNDNKHSTLIWSMNKLSQKNNQSFIFHVLYLSEIKESIRNRREFSFWLAADEACWWALSEALRIGSFKSNRPIWNDSNKNEMDAKQTARFDYWKLNVILLSLKIFLKISLTLLVDCLNGLQ